MFGSHKFKGKSNEKKKKKVKEKKMKEHENIIKFHIIFLFATCS